jgi:hypothetical protein
VPKALNDESWGAPCNSENAGSAVIRPNGFRILAPIALAALQALACETAAASRGVENEEVKALFRPTVAIESEELSTDGRAVIYSAMLRQRPPAGFKDKYLGELKDRGVTIKEINPSPYRPIGGRQGYVINVVQEVEPSPYTVRYKVATLQATQSTMTDFPPPVQISGRRLEFRLGSGILAPWTVHVVVPVTSTAQSPIAFPLPPGSVVVGVQDERQSSLTMKAQGRVKVDFLVQASPETVAKFVRTHVPPNWTPWRETPEEIGMAVAGPLPTWAPSGLSHMLVTAQPYLFTDPIGIGIPAQAYSARVKDSVPESQSLHHIPVGVFRYWLIFYFDMLS